MTIVIAHGGRFRAGHWRADAPRDNIAVPERPVTPPSPDPLALPRMGGARRDPATAANMAAHAAALAPRRWTPPK